MKLKLLACVASLTISHSALAETIYVMRPGMGSAAPGVLPADAFAGTAPPTSPITPPGGGENGGNDTKYHYKSMSYDQKLGSVPGTEITLKLGSKYQWKSPMSADDGYVACSTWIPEEHDNRSFFYEFVKNDGIEFHFLAPDNYGYSNWRTPGTFAFYIDCIKRSPSHEHLGREFFTLTVHTVR